MIAERAREKVNGGERERKRARVSQRYIREIVRKLRTSFSEENDQERRRRRRGKRRKGNKMDEGSDTGISMGGGR